MKRLCGFIGATAGSWVGWWLGAHVGVVTAWCVSAVGTGAGLWVGVRWASQYLP